MVRVNLIETEGLADQHLVAEYNEILMLLGYVRKYPRVEGIPERFCLGAGHVRFFKDKLGYLRKRHEALKKEMIKRGFKPRKSIDLSGFPDYMKGDWSPTERDKRIIRERLCEKISMKPGFYRHYRKRKSENELKRLVG